MRIKQDSQADFFLRGWFSGKSAHYRKDLQSRIGQMEVITDGEFPLQRSEQIPFLLRAIGTTSRRLASAGDDDFLLRFRPSSMSLERCVLA